MKVVIIHRKKRSGAYSIEELFHTIACELAKQIEIVEYEAGSRWRLFLDVWRLRKMDANIYHVTGDIHYIVNLLSSKKTVLTVHDINHYLLDLSGIKRWLYKWIWLVFPIRSAGVVTTISMETRDNIVKHLDIMVNRITVIENCHGNIFKQVRKKLSVECPVILQIGTAANKNVPRLIEALKGLHCRLVLIGRLDDDIKKKLAECVVQYDNFVGITQEALFEQYVECDIVSFVSIHEGFGVPIIEAQAVGRPVITANILPMSEVAGEGACLVDPLDVLQIREGIQRIIDDPVYRNQLIDNGLHNVSRYSPDTISSHYLALYKNMTFT